MNQKLDDAFVDEITRQNLLNTYDSLFKDYMNPYERIVPYFSYDEKQDQKQLRKLLKSLYRVIDWYSTTEQMKNVEQVL